MPRKLTSKTIFFIGFAFLSFVLISQLRDAYGWWPEFRMWDMHINASEEHINQTLNIWNYGGRWTPLFYYTIQSNIIAGFLLVIYPFIRHKKIGNTLITLGSAYMIILLAIFWTCLSPFMPWNLLWSSIENLVLHAIIPIIYIVVWWKVGKPVKNNWKFLGFAIIYPLLYYCWAWGFYLWIDGDASIYPFLNFYDPFFVNISNKFVIGIFNVGIFIVLIAACSLLILLTLRAKKWHKDRGFHSVLEID